MSIAENDSTRERILDVATRLLIERGYYGVGVNEIAREAGITRQAVYQGHFKSKGELLLALVDRVDQVAGAYRRVGRLQEARDGVEALEIAVEAVTAIEHDIHDIARVFESARTADPAFEAAWQDRMARRRGFSHAVMRRLEAEGRLADGWTTEDATDYMWATLSVWTYQALVVERGWPEEHYVERLKRVLRHALLRERAD